jgi:4-cresol dehydrogenase (hydroxylating)
VNKHGFDYLSEFIVGWRDARHVVDLRYDPARPGEARKANRCYAELLSTFTRNGWAVNRAATPFMDQVADSYGPAMRRLNSTIKKALDPNNILAPGKSGINPG